MGSRWQVPSLSKNGCIQKPIKMQFSLKPKIFSQAFLHFWNLHQILKILKKEGGSHSRFISEIIDCKKLGYLNAYKASRQNTYGAAEIFTAVVFSYFLAVWKKPSSKNSFLVGFEILRLFYNLWTPDDKYSLSVKVSV